MMMITKIAKKYKIKNTYFYLEVRRQRFTAQIWMLG